MPYNEHSVCERENEDLKQEKLLFKKALSEIIAIAEPHAEFTLAYEKICKIAQEVLEETE